MFSSGGVPERKIYHARQAASSANVTLTLLVKDFGVDNVFDPAVALLGEDVDGVGFADTGDTDV